MNEKEQRKEKIQTILFVIAFIASLAFMYIAIISNS
ncbi:hypothetical protein Pryu01_03131 [Paraliobacillus ryukyuensis]|uniref:Uncharacterized protein n=1 Tax=Paraliobacillus ryukyuensis TaxID=200904 RepID=A0A366DPB1_9BACI|nr:hypothetical protein DES48_1212 [Paraliobacillus ryukyuensis]